MRKFHRVTGRRRLFLKTIMTSLIMKGRIETTVTRAKEIRPRVERLVSIGKRQSVHDLRLLLTRVPKNAAYKIFHDLAPKYQSRPGGYLRIIKKASRRKRDSASLAIIEFV